MIKIETNILHKNNFKKSNINEKTFSSTMEPNICRCYEDIKKQEWLGMGGAITESSCYNFLKLTREKQQSLIQEYYGEDGLDYNLGRISIASNDFSLKTYQYTHKENLSDFSIDRDRQYILPVLKQILSYKKLTLVASPWSPPSIFKEHKILYFGDKLKKRHYEDYAKYLNLFINSYKMENIDIAFLTMQNEPNASQIWESCKFSLKEQKDFIYNYLIKEIQDEKTRILVWDHNKENLVEVANTLIENNPKVAGIALHSYTGSHSTNMEIVKNEHPNILLIQTEGCCGFSKYDEQLWINDAEHYIENLMSDVNHGLSGYIDWNILLNHNGGPSHKNNFCKSPIILNEKQDDFIKTPIYYYLLNISRNLKPGNKVIPIDLYRNDLYGIASSNNEKISVTLLNKNSYEIDVNVVIKNKYINDKILPHSIVTYISN